MKDWIWDLVLGLAFIVIHLGGLAVILWLCWIYLNGGF